ncbi:Kynurenine 3-monooxygenase [Endocarpon pusillum Z07020]|uniref:Kynurenine 3-monooxygenase n=1 Tax=Endocarpon pusillum (strain Z07020 / HMAS-L-300199) TaxID=1263415 RepID=U1HYK5_ENDPU|nr:Kynurenine 3-monooxygenase [Endocarpon pusillum Z07020]ERF75960.1 Kynurenine 3-monooxygenase [Endocarpon pusillum Z07020]
MEDTGRNIRGTAPIDESSHFNQIKLNLFCPDLRDTSTTPLNFTKSINLALSERGINALRHSQHPQLVNSIIVETIPMYGRMIHGLSTTGTPTQSPQAYDVHGRHISAVDRGGLNKRLLDELEKMPNVEFFFNHKLTGADFQGRKAWFEVRRQPEEKSGPGHRAPGIEVSFDLLLGADGAHSAARYHMMKYAQTNFSQEYIDTLWCEFTIPPSLEHDFRISPNHLHIWPAGDFMFIAIPSLDKSFTCTLFGPTSLFENLKNKKDAYHSPLEDLFTEHFPGIIPDLISRQDVHEQFNRNPHLPLINIKCNPHHFDSSVVILGDATNAIVPFYGQGMNAGLESVRILFEFLDDHGVYAANKKADEVQQARAAALAAYTAYRVPDAHCIADLALQNYIEMRSDVRSPIYRIRKFVEETLDRYLPGLGWATQYSRVSFGNERYSKIAQQTNKQGKILAMSLVAVAAGLIGGGGGLLARRWYHARQGPGWLSKWLMTTGREVEKRGR